MPKTFTIFAILFILTLIIIGLGRQISWSLEAGKRLDNAADETNKLQQKNRELKQRLVEVSSLDFAETLLRDKLNMAKPNETIVVIPDELLNQILGAKKVIEEPKLENWQGWLKLFWH